MSLHKYGVKFDQQQATVMSCQNANCEPHLKGWFTVLDVTSENGARLATWIKEQSRRRFYEWRSEEAFMEANKNVADFSITPEFAQFLMGLRPGLVVFAFPPGQRCFRQHLDREVIFTGRGYTFEKPREFNEAWNESADSINEAKKRG